ncbi:MAG: tryptophan--tRNA ligase, partial [Bacteroidota bacterium]
YGYGHAKQGLFELILHKFQNERATYAYYMSHTAEVEQILMTGANKAKHVAHGVLSRVRHSLGYTQ